MEETFDAFYRTLDSKKFKYFTRGEHYYVYNTDLDYLPAELKPKSEKSTFVRLQSIDNVIKEMLMVKKVPVEEYCGYTRAKRGFPGDYCDFLDICIGDGIPPTVFAVVLMENSEVDVSFIKDSKLFKCRFHDDDLLSNLFSLCSSNNCIEVLFNKALPNNSELERIFNNWGMACVESKYKTSEEMIKKYMKIDFEVVEFVKENCCVVDITDFDLVDFGLTTQQGKRLLSQWMRSPCLSQPEIERRLDLVESFSKINISVRKFIDLKRLTARICNRSITTQETVKLCQTLEQIEGLISAFKDSVCSSADLVVESFIKPLESLRSLFLPCIQQIKNTLNFSTSRVHTFLSEDLKGLESRKFEILAEVEGEFLKVKKDYPRVSFSNKCFKISRLEYNQSDFDSKKYVVTSMVKTGVFFLTKSLSELNGKILTVESEIIKVEHQIFQTLVNTLLGLTGSLETFNYLIALIDIYKALSHKVDSGLYSRPKFSETAYEVEDMHHPLLEHKDCILNSAKFTNNVCVLTGPNMGGKSTFIKTLGMISLYAQIGSYVPAKSALLPIFDKIFFRVGAKDYSSRKMSTFMVEMTELNRILRTATSQSLILIDELGRGTSAADGLSLALSVRDYLIRLGAKVVMATHFSELGNEATMNKKMRVEGNILTYRVDDGICDLSFGINVAELARFPEQVISMAKKYLND